MKSFAYTHSYKCTRMVYTLWEKPSSLFNIQLFIWRTTACSLCFRLRTSQSLIQFPRLHVKFNVAVLVPPLHCCSTSAFLFVSNCSLKLKPHSKWSPSLAAISCFKRSFSWPDSWLRPSPYRRQDPATLATKSCLDPIQRRAVFPYPKHSHTQTDRLLSLLLGNNSTTVTEYLLWLNQLPLSPCSRYDPGS